jgi:hypothetical protein
LVVVFCSICWLFFSFYCFAKWAHDNPDIWGYEFGGRMWHSKTAFGVADHERLTHDLIIVRLRKALNNWIDFDYRRAPNIRIIVRPLCKITT